MKKVDVWIVFLIHNWLTLQLKVLYSLLLSWQDRFWLFIHCLRLKFLHVLIGILMGFLIVSRIIYRGELLSWESHLISWLRHRWQFCLQKCWRELVIGFKYWNWRRMRLNWAFLFFDLWLEKGRCLIVLEITIDVRCKKWMLTFPLAVKNIICIGNIGLLFLDSILLHW